MIRWWWVRHAPVSARGFIGWTDIAADLSDEHSLSVLRSALPEDAALLTSDLARATQTAETLSRRTWMRLPAQEALREQNFGDWEGRSFDALTADEAMNFWSNPAGSAPPGGESFADVCQRVARAVNTCLMSQDHSDIVCVAHAGVVRAALALALELTPRNALSFEISALSLTRIDWLSESRSWRIGGVNVML